MAAPMPMSRPVELLDPPAESPAAEESAAGGVVGSGVGRAKGLTGATRSVNAPTVPSLYVVKNSSASPSRSGSSVMGMTAPWSLCQTQLFRCALATSGSSMTE